MKWFKEHKFIGILLFVLLITLALLGVTVGTGINGVNGLNKIYTGIEKPMVSIGDSIKKNISGIFKYRALLAENEKLKEENEKLSNEVVSLTMAADELKKLDNLSKALNYEFVKSGENIITADITAFDGQNWTNSFTIPKGTESGIKPGNIVISGKDLIGKVSDSGDGWSKIIPLIDEASHISFCLASNNNLIGIVKGNENGSLTGYMLDNKADVSEGDAIITSGLGAYPKGIYIGKISKFEYDSNQQLIKVTVTSDVDFRLIEKVSVIL